MSDNAIFDSVFAQLEHRNAMGSIQPTLRTYVIEWTDTDGFPPLKVEASSEREAVSKAATAIQKLVAEIQGEQPKFSNNDNAMFDRCFPSNLPAVRVLNSNNFPAFPAEFGG